VNLNDLQTWHYGAIIGGAVLVLSLIVYFLPARKLRVPAVLTAGIGGLAAGLAVGVIWLAGFGYKMAPPDEKAGDEASAAKEGMPKGAGAPKGGGGAPKGGGGAPKGGGGGPPGPRVQLVGLVNALDTLVDKPVALTISTDDRAAIAAQLKGLDAAGEIKDDEAKARLDAILKVLEKDRKALEAVGYRWPSPDGKGPPKGGPPKDSPNPFAEGPNKDRLKSLQERLDRK